MPHSIELDIESPSHGAVVHIAPPLANYRADIDGLRAIAVLVVFAFHAGIAWLPGGFVGVDIFFVISGWLITYQIVSAVNARTFSTWEFYKRRIIRIFPALGTMLFALLVWGYFYLYPDEFRRLAEETIATCFSLSNIYFYQHIGYFDEATRINPILHTWSLGVEEQFYIFFPLSIILIERFCPRKRKQALTSLLLLSFLVSVVLTRTNANAAFYLPSSRAWELLIGSFLATHTFAIMRRRYLPEFTLVIGIGLIGIACVYCSEKTPFPGVAALLPCLGAAAIILSGSGRDIKLGALLRWRPVAFIGKISYSLYLWHLPFIVMQRTSKFIDTGLSPFADRALAILCVFPVATASWWFVERPFRAISFSFSRGQRALVAAVGMGLVSCMALMILSRGGLPNRFPTEALRLASYLTYDPAPYFRDGKCFLLDRFTFGDFDQRACMATTPGKKTYMLIGDSHAAHLYAGLSRVYGQQNNILQATATGCKPVLQDRFGGSPCAQMNRYIFDEYLPTHHVDLLIISARWDKDDLATVRRTLQWLRSTAVPALVVGPTAEFDEELPRVLAAAVTKENPRAGISEHLLKRYEMLDRQMGQMVAATGTKYLDAYKLLCPSDCTYSVDGEPIMFDTGHLTSSGSQLLAQRLQQSGQLPR